MARTLRSNGQIALCDGIIEARKAAGLGQADMARRLRCQQSLVACLESGQRRIDVVEFIVLSRAIGFDPYLLLAIVAAATPPDHRI